MKLTEYKDQRHLIDTLAAELQRLRCLRDTPSHEGGGGYTVQALAVKICSLEEEIESELLTLVDEERLLREAINSLPDKQEKSILYKRYILCQRWTDISRDMHYTPRWIMRQHRKAVQHFYESQNKPL